MRSKSYKIKETSQKWLSKAVSKMFLLQGQKDLNPRHAVLEGLLKSPKS